MEQKVRAGGRDGTTRELEFPASRARFLQAAFAGLTHRPHLKAASAPATERDVSSSFDTRPQAAPPRIRARLALTILEVLQSQDAPAEVLEDENVAQTMPRRLGLSDVVDRQIQHYRAEARRRGRITDSQFADLVQLVVRRPDAPEIFWRVGRRTADAGNRTLVSRALPESLGYARLRRRVQRRLKGIFGRAIGKFRDGPFTLVGNELLFVRHTPGGESCYLVSGFCQSIVDEVLGDEYHVVHDRCEARSDDCCRWTIIADARVSERSRGSDMMPEPEAG